MLTDAPPRKWNLAGFQESDRLTRLDLPVDSCLPAIATTIESAMKAEETAGVRQACAEFLKAASLSCGVPECRVKVLAARPLLVVAVHHGDWSSNMVTPTTISFRGTAGIETSMALLV